jgi:hypothetical protein
MRWRYSQGNSPVPRLKPNLIDPDRIQQRPASADSAGGSHARKNVVAFQGRGISYEN